ncbi:hypothetical protein CORC01_12610 [Colletotrichum orchidophilum]|uniref:Uncharacterized protein n=1 Tax=Colletotrichum orchidophilum TaxID=1209926 RepID=A0A1G4ASK3_9PEZI|nr:uncharacterized protein CORC01_12610 [Colletotrichum orchidophilum]OHE92095.1 hypothetical protein CORC01_12610 [Colletotrichum orchidophilum]
MDMVSRVESPEETLGSAEEELPFSLTSCHSSITTLYTRFFTIIPVDNRHRAPPPFQAISTTPSVPDSSPSSNVGPTTPFPDHLQECRQALDAVHVWEPRTRGNPTSPVFHFLVVESPVSSCSRQTSKHD